MTPFSISTILILINIIVSYCGFKDHFFLEKYTFKIDPILVQKDYKRLVTSGFLRCISLAAVLKVISEQ